MMEKRARYGGGNHGLNKETLSVLIFRVCCETRNHKQFFLKMCVGSEREHKLFYLLGCHVTVDC